ncbi:MAG: hypothetical protein KBS43_02865 [Oscillospiraceae bacterium]|nr:hypothetical protein [Candidatus Limimonas coprohippi]MCQ2488104.1 hypothetical protein [Clostridia bacterium]
MGLFDKILEPIEDEDGNVEHLFDEPLFEEDLDFVDELEILDMLFDD